MNATRRYSSMTDHLTLDMTVDVTLETADTDLVSGRWEPCEGFAPEVPDSQVCGDCGWLHDDHRGDAVIRQLPVRQPRSVQPRRLAS
jgi:hypothetical protein